MFWIPCPARRFLEGDSAHGYCAHPRVVAVDQRVTPEMCAVCNYAHLPPPETFHTFPLQPPPSPRGTCRWLGATLGLRACASCRGHVQVKVFACGHPAHTETTLQECLVCPDHQEIIADLIGKK